jgi:hypothetical protein
MSDEDIWKELEKIISDYVETARNELHQRWKQWPLNLAHGELYEVVGSLLARQVTLVTQLARAPSIWNGHIAPLLLRTMTDAYINLAWIFMDPINRARQFIMYGLGQEKLQIEHRKTQLEADGIDVASDPLIKFKEQWLNSQRFAFLTEVSVGSWTGTDTRTMAEEAGCLDLYRYAYTPFSAATHNMWHHVSNYNLVKCPNPLHRYHKIPMDPSLDIDPDYLYRAAKYVAKTFSLFDEKTGITYSGRSAFEQLADAFEKFGESINKEAQSGEEGKV